MIRIRKLQSSCWLPLSIGTVFPFFTNVHNLDLLTPEWLHFRVLTPADVLIQEGTLLDYRLKLRGIPLRWQSQITVWDPPHCFVDEQKKGPYLLWIHEHHFVEKDGGTLVNDYVHYAVPGGPLFEPFLHHLFVGPDVERIFEYRRNKLEELHREGKM